MNELGQTSLARVLVVDDEPAIARALRRILKHSYDVVTCDAASTALEWLRAGAQYRAIVCDLSMPQMSGMDLYERLSRELPGTEAKIVFVTGGACTEAEYEFLERIENVCVSKPVCRERLEAALATLGQSGDRDRFD